MVNKPKIGITMGDPSGIGPEIILKALVNPSVRELADFLVIGDFSVLQDVYRLLGLAYPVNRLYCNSRIILKSEYINLLDMENIPKRKFQTGKVNVISGRASIEYIDMVFRLIKSKDINIVVTAPINKEAINKAGYGFFGGHTEYFAHLTHVKDIVMMLVGGPLRVSLVTRHLALKNVSDEISVEKVYKTIKLTHQALRNYFDIAEPKIGICSLNPHCADGGMFGSEEREVIGPAIQKSRRRIPNLFGPIPSDSIFYDAYHGRYDAVVAMYHDQGLGPLKMVARDYGVNLTLGLPFIRTSPDHGTGFDIAGKGTANPQSMIEAIKLAVQIWKKMIPTRKK